MAICAELYTKAAVTNSIRIKIKKLDSFTKTSINPVYFLMLFLPAIAVQFFSKVMRLQDAVC
jgi:hypothetical protein